MRGPALSILSRAAAATLRRRRASQVFRAGNPSAGPGRLPPAQADLWVTPPHPPTHLAMLRLCLNTRTVLCTTPQQRASVFHATTGTATLAGPSGTYSYRSRQWSTPPAHSTGGSRKLAFRLLIFTLGPHNTNPRLLFPFSPSSLPSLVPDGPFPLRDRVFGVEPSTRVRARVLRSYRYAEFARLQKERSRWLDGDMQPPDLNPDDTRVKITMLSKDAETMEYEKYYIRSRASHNVQVSVDSSTATVRGCAAGGPSFRRHALRPMPVY